MIETLLGGLLGGAFRLAPELLKWIDRKGERAHELAMQDKTLQIEKQCGAQQMAQHVAHSDTDWSADALRALKESVAAQGQHSGVKWADALSVTVRPVITYWMMSLYCAARVACFVGAVGGEATLNSAVQAAWTDADQALWAGVLNFWFLGRVFDRAKP